MSGWRIVPVADGDELAHDLTDSELLGLSITVNLADPGPISRRAWEKIQPQVAVAIDERDTDDEYRRFLDNEGNS